MHTSYYEPYFSVIIPTYNLAHLVPATIESVLAQSFRDYELIVVNDGSTDSTAKVLEAYSSRVKVIHRENGGAESARRLGSDSATGRYLVLLDHDDLLSPDALEVYHQVAKALNEPPLIISQIRHFRSDSDAQNTLETSRTITYLRYPNFLSRDRNLSESCSQLIIRRTVAQKTGALRAQPTAFPFDSCGILVSLASVGPCVKIASPATISHRYHAANNSAGIEKMIAVLPRLVRTVAECKGANGWLHTFGCYAFGGGVASDFARRALRARRINLVAQVLFSAAPMVAAALARRLVSCFRSPQIPQVLLTQKAVAEGA